MTDEARYQVSTHYEGVRRVRRDEAVDTGYIKERYMSDTELMKRATPVFGGGGPDGEWLSYKERAAAREELNRRWGSDAWSEADVGRWTGWEMAAVVAGVMLTAVVACQRFVA